MAGCCLVDEVFRQLDCTVSWVIPEGNALDLLQVIASETPIVAAASEGIIGKPRRKVAEVEGTPSHILLGERLSLNILSRCSSIATK
jgi:nicotinate-nucleotide pyrophosphorylase (carboxylating)